MMKTKTIYTCRTTEFKFLVKLSFYYKERNPENVSFKANTDQYEYVGPKCAIL